MKLTAYDRAKVLKKTAELMRERADSIAKTLTLEQGKPWPRPRRKSCIPPTPSSGSRRKASALTAR